MNTKDAKVRRSEYDAAGTYQEEMKQRRVGGNIPMELVGRIRTREINAMFEDPSMKAALVAGYSVKVQKIMTMDKAEKLEALAELTVPQEIKAAIAAETDPDIIRYLADRYAEASLTVAR